MRLLYSLIVWILLANPLAARQTPQDRSADSVYTLPPIRITAARYQIGPHEAPQRISILDANDVRGSGSRNLGELLDRAGPMFIRRYGNGLASVSLRGAGASQTLILLDGLPISDPQLGQIDLSLISTGLIEQIAVSHGAGSSLYGSSGMAGVIDIRTLPTGRAPSLEASLTAGPYGERRAALSMAGGSERIAARIHATHGVDESDFPFLDESLLPPQRVRRQGADRTQTSLLGSLQYRGNLAATTASVWINHAERGLPGPASAAPQNERQWDNQFRSWIAHTQSFDHSILDMRGAFQRNALRYAHPGLDIDQTGHTTSTSLEGDWKKPLDETFEITSGFETAFRSAHHPNLASTAREYQVSLFSLGQIALGRTSIFPSWRMDGFFPGDGRRMTAFSPQLGINLQPFRSPGWRLKANAGRAFRAPTFNDRYWQPGGNPLLEPERGWTMEAGASYDSGEAPLEAGAEVSLFQHRFRNQITWLPASQGFWSPQNISRTRSTGIEASGRIAASVSPRSSIAARIFYTLTETSDRSDPSSPSYGKPLRYAPRHQVKASLSAGSAFRRAHASLDLFFRYLGLRYVTTDATQSMPSHVLLDAQAQVAWQIPVASFTAGFFLENVLNTNYEIIKGYPMPPLSARFQLTVRLIRSADTRHPK